MSIRRRVEQLERRMLPAPDPAEDVDGGRRLAAAPAATVRAYSAILMRVGAAGCVAPRLKPGADGELRAGPHVVAPAGEWEALRGVLPIE